MVGGDFEKQIPRSVEPTGAPRPSRGNAKRAAPALLACLSADRLAMTIDIMFCIGLMEKADGRKEDSVPKPN